MDLIESKSNALRHPWELARAEVIADLLTSISKRQNILDLGCGDLFMADYLYQQFPGSSFTAVDSHFSDEQLKKYRAGYPQIKSFASLKEIPPSSAPFDLVLVLDVIEHIKDDQTFLNSLSDESFVNESTKFLITVPAYQSLFSAHDEFLHHYRRYSVYQLEELVKKAGFKPMKSGYFFFSLLPLRRIKTWMEKVRGSRPEHEKGIGAWNKGRFVTSLLKNILLVDYHLASGFARTGFRLPGLSAYILCRKSV